MELAVDRVRRRRLADLCDTVRICGLIGFIVALGLPWWVQTDPLVARVGVYTGLASLRAGSAGEGYAWWGVIAAGVGLGTFPFKRSWVSFAGAVVTALAAAAMAVTALVDHLGRQGSIADGTWVAFLLLLIIAAASLTAAFTAGSDAR